jgi:adenosylcobinamide amidohydrolase
MDLVRERNLLVARFSLPQQALSWAPVGGGRCRTHAVVWRQTTNAELGPDTDAVALLSASLAQAGLDGAVGMLTAHDLSVFDDVTRREGATWARCVVTVGLSNALAVGDPPGPLTVGTINLLCSVSQPLTEAALVEACALAAEARTAALLARAFPSRRSGRPSTGTGTDCIVVTAPDGVPAERYVGKHTLLGSLIGGAVHEACARGVARWLDER